MDKILNFALPALGVSIILGVIGGYFYLTALPDVSQQTKVILDDQVYLKDNQQAYADCYYTTKSNSDFSIAQVTNKYFNSGVSKDRLVTLEAQFLEKYSEQCKPVITNYENRFIKYQENQKLLASARLTELDKLLKKKADIEKIPSDTVSFYQMYEPKSLQYPSYSVVKLLYTADDYVTFLNQNLK